MGLYHRWQRGNFQAVDVTDFLWALLRQVQGPVLLLWDRGSIHKGPAIADVGDVAFLVEDGKTGFVVPRGDEAALLARLVTLMTDHDLCRRMGEAGRAKAERQFGLDRLVSETLAAYRVMEWKGA
jgi:hypothetical protein